MMITVMVKKGTRLFWLGRVACLGLATLQHLGIIAKGQPRKQRIEKAPRWLTFLVSGRKRRTYLTHNLFQSRILASMSRKSISCGTGSNRGCSTEFRLGITIVAAAFAWTGWLPRGVGCVCTQRTDRRGRRSTFGGLGRTFILTGLEWNQ